MLPFKNWTKSSSAYFSSSFSLNCSLFLNSGNWFLLLLLLFGETRLLGVAVASIWLTFWTWGSRGMRCPGRNRSYGGRGSMWRGGFERIMAAGNMLFGSISFLRILTNYNSFLLRSSSPLSYSSGPSSYIININNKPAWWGGFIVINKEFGIFDQAK